MNTRRYLTARDFPLHRDPADDMTLCRICGKRCKYKQARVCSAECRETSWVLMRVASQRWRVERRDKGVCALCGWDTGKLERIVARSWSLSRRVPRSYVCDCLGLPRELSFWEMDHIISVAKGGGVHPGMALAEVLGNLRTLCVPCHRARRRDGVR